MQNFSRGDLCPTVWVTLDGISVLNIKATTLDLDVEKDDVSPITNGANTSLICGKGNAEGNIVADYDLDFPPLATLPKIVPGVPGLLLGHVSPSEFFVLPMRVLKFHHAITTETAVQYSFDVGLDCSYGNIFFPKSPTELSLALALTLGPATGSSPSKEATALVTALIKFLV